MNKSYGKRSVRISTAEIGLDRIPNQPYKKIDSPDPLEVIGLAQIIDEVGRDISRLRARKKEARGDEKAHIKEEYEAATERKSQYEKQLEEAWRTCHGQFSSAVSSIMSEKEIQRAVANWDSIDGTRFYREEEMTPSIASRAYGLLSTLMMSADLGKNKARAAAVTALRSGISRGEYVHFFPEPWAVADGLIETTRLNDEDYLRKMAEVTVERHGRITSPVYRLAGAPPTVAENWDQLEAAQRIIGERVAQERSGSGIDVICCDYIGDTIIEIHIPPIGMVGGYMASINGSDEDRSPIGLLERELKRYFNGRQFERAVIVANEKYNDFGLFRHEIDRIATAIGIHADGVDIAREQISQAEIDKYELVFLYGNPLQATPNERQEVINGKKVMDVLECKVSMLHFVGEIRGELKEVGIRIPTNYVVEGRSELPHQLQKYLKSVPKNGNGVPEVCRVTDIAARARMQGELIELLKSQGITSSKVLIKPRVHRAVLETAHGSLTKPPFLDVNYLPMAMQALDIIVRNDGGIFEQQIEPNWPFVERRLYSVVVKE